MPGRGKDGFFYKDDNELKRADNKWLQQEEQKKELEKQNKIMQEQHQAIEYQNRLIQEQIQQAKRQQFIEELKLAELKEQTKINKENQYIESLSPENKELYPEMKDLLITINNSIDKIEKDIYNIINNRSSTQLWLSNKLNKVNSIGFGSFIIKLIIISILSLILVYFSTYLNSNTEVIMGIIIVVGCIAIALITVSNVKKHRQSNKVAKNLRKQIKILGNKINELSKLNIPNKIEYIYEIGIDNMSDYVEKTNTFKKTIIKQISEIADLKEDIEKQINDLEVELKEIYEKSEKRL